MRCIRGHEDSRIGERTVSQVVDDVWHIVFYGALCRCRCHADAEDITQQALAEAIVKMDCRYDLNEFANDQALQSCLHKIAVHCAGEHLRKVMRSRQGKVRLPEDYPELEDGGFHERADATATAEVAVRLRELLGQLSERDRLVVEKYVWEDMTFARIGEEFGCTPQTVWERFRKAIRQAASWALA